MTIVVAVGFVLDACRNNQKKKKNKIKLNRSSTDRLPPDAKKTNETGTRNNNNNNNNIEKTAAVTTPIIQTCQRSVFFFFFWFSWHREMRFAFQRKSYQTKNPQVSKKKSKPKPPAFQTCLQFSRTNQANSQANSTFSKKSRLDKQKRYFRFFMFFFLSFQPAWCSPWILRSHQISCVSLLKFQESAQISFPASSFDTFWIWTTTFFIFVRDWKTSKRGGEKNKKTGYKKRERGEPMS